jgi:glycosyltransferase involved in cell wall biosynthesis
LKVVLVEPDLEDCGAIRVDLERAARWGELGARVVVVVLERKEERDRAPVPPGVEVRFVTRRPLRFRYVYVLALLKVWWLARRSDVVVSGREMQFGVVVAARAARAARRPLAVTMHSWQEKAMAEHVDPRHHDTMRRAVAAADLVVCVSDALAAATRTSSLRPAGVHTVRNGIDAGHVRRSASSPPEVPLPEGPLVVGCGRLNDEKGFDVLVRAHAQALADGAAPHRVVVMGEGPRRGALQSLACELGVEGSVTFAGFATNPWSVLARADLFVLPSRYEGLTLTLLEALALGVPVAASACSGPEEILEGGRYGALFPVEDVAALARVIGEHLGHRDDLVGRAEAGAALVAERYDVALAARAHLDLLSQLGKVPAPR